MSRLPATNSALYTVYQPWTELEIYCGDTDSCGLGSWLLKFIDHTQSVGLLCTSDQSVTQAATCTTHKQMTNNHAFRGNRTSDPSNQVAAKLQLRPQGHRRLEMSNAKKTRCH